MKYSKGFLVGLLLCCSAALPAQTFNFVSSRQIKYVIMYGDYAAIQLAQSFTNASACNTTWANEWLVLDWSVANGDPALKSLLAVVMIAYTTNKPVAFAIEGCHSWGGGVGRIYRIDMVP